MKDVTVKKVGEHYVGYKRGTRNNPVCIIGKNFVGCLLVEVRDLSLKQAKQELKKILEDNDLLEA